MSLDEAVRSELEQLIASDDVVLFMKGRRTMPQCGFSAQVVQILNEHVDSYTTVNVLTRPEIREGIKAFSSWPTIPQLYIKGEFVGGCDIVKDLNARGELEQLLGKAPAEIPPPTVALTDAAVRALDSARDPNEPKTVRFEVGAAFDYGLAFDQKKEGDFEVPVSGGYTLLVDRSSARRCQGVTVDFIEQGGGGGGFKIDNPAAPPKVQPMSPKDLKAKLDAGEAVALYDVRTPEERSIARIEPSTLLDEAAAAAIGELDRDTPLVFYCRSGQRSQQAAEYFLQQGFKKVFNLSGGIHAWSREVDPSVPQY